MKSPTYILGLNCNIHQSSAVLIKDGILIAAAEEERFTRKKFDNGFPDNAINYCLREAEITLTEVQYAGFYWQPWKGLVKRIWWLIRYFPASLETFRGGKKGRGSVETFFQHLAIPYQLRKRGFKGAFYYVDHHLAHAASAFFVSPYDHAAIFTTDFCGEHCTTLLGVGVGNTITVRKRFFLPHSLGLYYGALTQYLGYKINADEYRVMGLAPYGKPKYTDTFASMIKFNDGELVFDNSWSAFHFGGERVFSEKWVECFGPPCINEDAVEHGEYKHYAASGQKVLDDIFVAIGTWLQSQTKEHNVCLAGGVALNSVANGKLKMANIFENVWVQPASYDPGCALGACFYIWHQKLGHPRSFVMEHAYWGPAYTEDEMRLAAENHGLVCEYVDDIEKKTAALLADGEIIGWYQGRMEWGPRALGNRSILADPRCADIKDVVNRKIKFREPYRPFAPSVLEEDAHLYFEIEGPSPYMIFVCKVREIARSLIPAVTHVDGSSRIQTVSKKTNQRYWNLLNEFKKLTDIGVLLNTSFNVKGEPIVCTPEEAVCCFLKTDMDHIVMGKFLCSRPSDLHNV
ncbi:hypothetical protein A2609_01770 [Candidatus Kaiserbacteria bacterium RIFOXYD1_FULL_47_14]|uniref:Carbamoyltransferase n=1 Tax=Candidatus Kaiserbacteria bacterium RIFOXYD1_FULL_47_14 TaxID=1798533 RepID=A0A1F6G4A7_9BACT|nr:MAG: hypothetical protein A2609_01770 [Candidatus Kaiserbacteria bacterium RIFOXYD1_FULL_47_14]